VPNISAIDPDSWQVTVLPLPKGFSRGAAYGFCQGNPVGRAETARAVPAACWWPGGQPELLTFDEKSAQFATGRPVDGDIVPGHRRGQDGAMRAAAWSLRGTSVVAEDLHLPDFASTWATGAGGGLVVGIGTPASKPGVLSSDVGLVWRNGQSPTVIEADGDVRLLATDGLQIAGGVRNRAVLWPTASSAPIDLSPEKAQASEIQALDGDLQIGTAWRGVCARAGLWRGTAASFIDLTPKGFETGRAYGGAMGLQVGCVRRKDATRNGSAACDDRAILWHGAPDRWFDLNELLPKKDFNASVAWAIVVVDCEVRICGEATRCEVSDAGTNRESHSVPVARPVVWTARLLPDP
jgi:hypothetical protein